MADPVPEAADERLTEVLSQHPELSAFGFGTFNLRLSPDERAAQIAMDRAALLEPNGQEQFAIGYTPNGAFFAAAYAEGFTVQRIHDGPNAWFNLSSRVRR